MTKAVLQGVAFAFKDSQNALATAGTQLQNVFAIGGGSNSRYWLQMLASTLDLPLLVTVDGDFGASLGAARLGMIAAENADPLSICTPPAIEKTIEPEPQFASSFSEQYERYKQSYHALKGL
jgi:xylulokinase